jgi:NAD(P)H-flavin reductase
MGLLLEHRCAGGCVVDHAGLAAVNGMGAAQRMNLEMVHVLTDPPDGWQGENGFITADVLDKHLGSDRQELHYFICCPILMITAVQYFCTFYKSLLNLTALAV